MKTTTIKTYEELITMDNYLDRYRYLKLDGIVAHDTFGSKRWMNQMFYRSKEWRQLRNKIIIRDKGCDLGLIDYPIGGRIIIHHLNPITIDDFTNNPDCMLDPNNVVCVSHNTHEAIHFGDEKILGAVEYIERKPNDTCPWL